MANTTGLGDTIYAAVRKALEDANGSSSSGGGSASTTDVYLWNTTENYMDVMPSKVQYVSGVADRDLVYTDLQTEEISKTVAEIGETFHGLKVLDAPVGSLIRLLDPPDTYNIDEFALGYGINTDPTGAIDMWLAGHSAPMPIEGVSIVGSFSVTKLF